MNELEIIVKGPSGSGRSTMIELLHRLLLEEGLTNIKTEFLDKNPEAQISDIDRLIIKNPPIAISEFQMPRLGCQI